MPYPKLLPPFRELEEMANRGMTQQQIADVVNDRNRRVHGLDFRPVTRSGVAQAFMRNCSPKRRPTYRDVNPWRAPNRYQRDHPVSMLRLAKRVENGEEIPEKDSRFLQSWLTELKRHDAVVSFDPDKGGYFYAKRRPGIDLGLIREPNK